MDPRLLLRDELDVELNIRGIDRKLPNAIEVLSAVMEEELAGLKPMPTKLHAGFRTANSEIAALDLKLPSIVISKGELPEIAKCHARLLHFLGRVTRMEPECMNNAHVVRMKAEIETRLSKCSEIMMSLISNSPVESIRDSLEMNAQRQEQDRMDLVSTGDGNVHAPEQPTINPQAIDENAGAAAIANLSVITPTTATSSIVSQNVAAPSTSSSWTAPIPQGQIRSTAPPFVPQNMSQASNTQSQQPLQQQLSTLVETFTRLLAQVSAPAPPNYSTPRAAPVANVPNGAPGASSYAQPNPVSYGPATGNRPAGQTFVNTQHGLPVEKWPIRYGGSIKDGPVDDFIFRVEALGKLANIPQSALTFALYQLLTGTAASWFWLFMRNEPNATWAQTRRDLSRAFQCNVSDEAIRRMIMDRLQRPGERYVEYQIAIQELEVRLTVRMTQVELLDTLRRNLLPHLQEKLLFHQLRTVSDLQCCVHRLEEFAQQQSEIHHIRRPINRVHEITTTPKVANEFGVAHCYPQNFCVPPPPINALVESSHQFAEQIPMPNYNYVQENTPYTVEAIEDRNQYVRCWNCDELGHSFMDCSAQRIIFCYGCGTKGCVRPQCSKCSLRTLQGNGRGSVRPMGHLMLQQRQAGPPLQYPMQQQRPR